MKAPLLHLAGMIFNEPLAILPEKLEAILHAIGPRLIADADSLDEMADLLQVRSGILKAPPSIATGSTGTNQALDITVRDDLVVDAKLQQPNGNGNEDKPYRLTPEGIAVIPVRGTLMKRFSYLGAASGFSSYASVAQAAQAALADAQVKGVLLDVDSPGGSTHGCFELSDLLYQMRGGQKPMWAIANDLAASAAYALASSVDRVWVTRTGGVGSVGVFALHADQSGFDEQAGVKYTYIYAGEKKTDGNPHEALSKSAKSDIQAEVDRENQIFVATVARNRGFAGANYEKIAGTKAGVYFAQNAVSLLADEVGTCEEALEALTAKVNGSMIGASGKVVAISTESGNNDAEGGQPQGETKTMPIKETQSEAEDALALAAAAPKDDEDEDDGEEKPTEDAKSKANKSKAKAKGPQDDEDSDDKARRSSVTEMPQVANSPAKRIAELCQIAGAPELAADYIVRGYSVDKVIEKLSARRAKASAEGSVNSYVSGSESGGGQVSVDAAIKQSRVMAANSGDKMKPSQCMERLLRANPEIYASYLEEKNRVMSQISFSGGGKALNDYILNNQRRYMANLGLGTTIEDVPGRRSM